MGNIAPCPTGFETQQSKDFYWYDAVGVQMSAFDFNNVIDGTSRLLSKGVGRDSI